MKKLTFIIALFFVISIYSHAQKLPTGNSADFKVKTCLHSVSYLGIWRGQTPLSVDEFLVKAKELGAFMFRDHAGEQRATKRLAATKNDCNHSP